MSLIQVQNVTFSYENSGDIIFENMSFQIDSDWKLGFIGRNGRGKTTFLKLLMGELEYRGKILSDKKFEYFPYEIKEKDKEKWPVEIAAEMIPQLEEWRLFKEINLLKIKEEALYRPFSSLSPGERTKVLLAVLFLKENHFLLIDEPTNHLDREARRIWKEYLSTKKGFILVSHDRDFLDGCVNHVLALNKSDMEVQQGNFSSWYQNKCIRDRFELAQDKKIRGEVKRLTESAKRNENWSNKVESTKKGSRVAGLKPDKGHIGRQAARMMRRAKSIEKRREDAIEEKSRLLKNLETIDTLKIMPLSYHKNRFVQFREVSFGYGERTIGKKITFEICTGERVCLIGKNGSGKSSIMKLILQKGGKKVDAPSLLSGEIEVGSGLKISWVSQDTSWLEGSIKDFIKERGIEERLFKAVLKKLDFGREQFEKEMQDYSQGQKKKVLLAASLCTPAHLYIWDEPLNYIDIFSRMQLEELLLQYRPALLFVEHDESFARKVATKRILIESF